MSIAHQFDFVLLSYSINVFQLIKCGQQKEEDEEKGELNKVTKEVKHVVNRHPHTHTHTFKNDFNEEERSPIASPSSMWTPTLKGTVKLQTVPCVFQCNC